MIRTVLAACFALLAATALAADKRYPLSNQGSLVVPVPATWKDEMRQEPIVREAMQVLQGASRTE